MSESIMPLNGVHTLNIRAKDIDGNWSPAFRRVVVVEDQTLTRDFNITNAEYSWDSDTGIPLIAFDGDFNSAIEDVVSSSSLTFPSGGVHVFNIRVQDEDGNWSPNFRRVINFPVTNYSRDLYVTQAEYFWDTDPGEGSGIPLIAFDGAFDQALEDLYLPTLSLSNGVSVFNIRVKDIDGNWSPPFQRVVSLEAAYGCTDTLSFNYNPLAFYDNGTCIDFAYGCMDITAFNYDPLANTDDGTCIEFVYGCMDDTQFNYNPLANTEDDTCIAFAYGCMDTTAFNYDPLANTDDGTCIEFVYGCMDDTQFNYNPLANTEDDTCIAFAYGCIDSTAFNYDPLANTDDGTCITDCVGSECCVSGTQWDLNTLTCIYEDLCPADIAKDGFVAVDDLLELLSAYGSSCDEVVLGIGGEYCIGPECCGENTIWCESLEICIPFISCPADLTYDQSVGVNDLLTFLISYGEGCEEYEILPDCEVTYSPWMCGDLIEHEGYDYSTVQIGEQCWFSENCRYLPEVSPSSEGSDTDPYFYVYGYEGTDASAAMSTAYYETYGALYNWPAVMANGGSLLCPSGWHMPSDGEFTELTDFLGGEGVAGGKMKEAGYEHWNSSNTGATNSSGWTGLPGGYRYSGGFDNNGYYGYWWSASESGSYSWIRSL